MANGGHGNVPRDKVFRLIVVYCSLLLQKKLAVSYQVYPKEFFGTVFICSSLNVRNSQLADCGKRGSKSS